MVEKVRLQPETVQTLAKDLNGMGEDVRDADAQWKGATRGNANFFEQMLEKDLKRSARAFRRSRERLHEAVQEYAQRLSTTVDIFTKTEESQMDAINDAQAKVAAAPSADSTGHASASGMAKIITLDESSSDGGSVSAGSSSFRVGVVL